SDRRPEFRCRKCCARAGNLRQGGVDRNGCDDCLHDPGAMEAGTIARWLVERSGYRGGRRAGLSLRLVESPGAKAGLHLQQHVPGPRQYQAGTAELADAPVYLCGACDLALDAAGLPDRACLVSVDRDDDAPGRLEPVAAAPRVQEAVAAAGAERRL